MNYNNPALIDKLAGEYVLGTLRGAARRRFQALMSANIPIRNAVHRWEQQLAPLSLRTRPVAPPPHVWQKIEQVIQPTSAQPALSSQRVRLWQSLAASIAVIAIGLAAVLVTRAPEVQVQALAPAHVALVADQNKSLWLVNAYPQLGELRARALGALTLAQNQAFELWMLPDGGRAPVSLGLLPVAGEARLPLSAAAVQILAATSTLAVSLEPAGGSPTGAPTGPVLYTAALIHTQG